MARWSFRFEVEGPEEILDGIVTAYREESWVCDGEGRVCKAELELWVYG